MEQIAVLAVYVWALFHKSLPGETNRLDRHAKWLHHQPVDVLIGANAGSKELPVQGAAGVIPDKETHLEAPNKRVPQRAFLSAEMAG
jgi:hypothetical protein